MTNSENARAPYAVEFWGGDGAVPEDTPRRIPAGSREQAYALAETELEKVSPDVTVGVAITAVTEVARWSGATARDTQENIAAWRVAPVVPVATLLERIAALLGPEVLLAEVEAIAAEHRARAPRRLSVVGES